MTAATDHRPFVGKVALVAGASRGIGAVTARAFADAGAAVVLGSRDERALAEVAAGIRDKGGQALAVGTDVTDPASVERLVASAVDEYGRLDAAFNNASNGPPPTPLADLDPAEFDRVIDSNVRGTFLGLRSEIRAMLPTGGGAIVNMASLAGVRGVANLSGYVAGKAGIIGLTKVMAKEWGRYNVNVNAVGFGFIETRLTQALGGEIDVQGRKIKVGVQEAAREALRAQNPLGRFGTAEEAAGPVLFFCSPLSDYVTGEVLLCSGGSRV